ncbi:hypothetical protein Pan258_12410 [Symmachiella dynata]|nr:hypothetical protein Pan258_12410 [Symmachiella dynata]
MVDKQEFEILRYCPDISRVALNVGGNQCAGDTSRCRFSRACQSASPCVGGRELRLLAGFARPDSEAIAATPLCCLRSNVALADEPPVAPVNCLGSADGGEDSFAAGAFPVGVDHDFD